MLFLLQPLHEQLYPLHTHSAHQGALRQRFAGFAAGCSRTVISNGAEMLGWSLDDLITETILAMRKTPAARFDE